MVGCWGQVHKFRRLRKEAALESRGTPADTSVSLVRVQQGEQTAAGMTVVFYTSSLMDITYAW